MREALVQPEHLPCASAHEDVLVEADHVLEFVDERHRDEPLDIGGRVRSPKGSAGSGADRVKAPPLLGWRWGREGCRRAGPEEEPDEESPADAGQPAPPRGFIKVC